jgi:hypothetical protein
MKNLQVNIPEELKEFLKEVKTSTGMPIERTVAAAIEEFRKKHGQKLTSK